MGRTNHERIRILVALIFAAGLLNFYILLIRVNFDFATLRALDGRPIALDFSNFWAASKLALSGRPILAYNIDELHGIERQLLGTQHAFLSGFFYPPIYLLYIIPLGLLSYIPSLIVWVGVTFLLYILVLVNICKNKAIIPLLIVFPGMFENMFFGQNAFLSGFLIGGGLLMLNSSPIIAGCLFGFLCYKPQFFPLLLITLMIGKYWKIIITAISTAILLSIISIIVFGCQIWSAYFNVMPMPIECLTIGQDAWDLMPTFFVAVLSAGFSVIIAYIVQSIVMVIVLMGISWIWMKKDYFELKGAILIIGLLLFTPYALLYEMALLALPLCWLWEDGRMRGRLPGESLLLLCSWLMPFFLQILWWRLAIFQGKLQIGPLILMLLFLLTLIKGLIWQKQR
jgi:hypothetical protein